MTFAASCGLTEKHLGSMSKGGFALALHLRTIGDKLVKTSAARRTSD